jgi:TonB family protein
VLAAVRRNWFAIMPESAKFGSRGRVALQFSIDREGRVPKLVIVNASGIQALDRAAVAGVSASNPFPPLPNEFRGAQIRLQLTFSYNVPSN